MKEDLSGNFIHITLDKESKSIKVDLYLVYIKKRGNGDNLVLFQTPSLVIRVMIV